jgi:copper(I)-binding protein
VVKQADRSPASAKGGSASRSMPPPAHPLVVAALAVVALLGPAGCGAGAGGSGSDARIEVADPWGRPTPPRAESAAFYLIVTNPSAVDDRLLGASSERCLTIELHDTTMVDGVMAMRPATEEALVVPAGRELLLEPAGLHAMCIDPPSPLVEGESIPLTLRFDRAGSATVSLQVEQR